jgi:hypothetical protein
LSHDFESALLLPDNCLPRDTDEAMSDAEESPALSMKEQLLQDPEVIEALKNPRVKAAYDDVMANPGNFLSYLGDPEIQPLISKCKPPAPLYSDALNQLLRRALGTGRAVLA